MLLYTVYICIGLEHHIVLKCCECEPVTTTMVRMGIWPASAHYPQLAFTFTLMDWVEALMMECQVALKDFCAALYFKCPYVVNKVTLLSAHSRNSYLIL